MLHFGLQSYWNPTSSTLYGGPNPYRDYFYGGWNLALEQLSGSGSPQSVRYVWGRDLSGTLDGAGGVGCLLATEVNGVWYFPVYDANGNVTDYVSETGEVVASYSYDAFGRTIAKSGAMADTFPFRFSTKYFDAETGLYYYGYRYYSPELGRWLTRDPIEENGGDNLYAFCGNNGLDRYDALGLYNKKVGDYIVTVDSSELSDQDFEAEARRLIPGEFDKTMYGFTIPKNPSGKLNYATTSPAYEWEKIVGCNREICWQLKKKRDGKYEIVQRLMQSKLNHLYIGVYSPLNTPSVSLKEHENTHVKHLMTYVQKMSDCYRCLSVLRVNEGQKGTIDQYIKEMDKHYDQLALGISKKMDAIHYRRDLKPADVFEPFKNAAEEALETAKKLAESSYFKGVSCDEWIDYINDLPIP